jgi:hypothetical protein
MFKYRQNYKLVQFIRFPIQLFTKKVDVPRHMKVLNLPKSKILSKDEIRAEYLKLGIFRLIQLNNITLIPRTVKLIMIPINPRNLMTLRTLMMR